MPPGARYAVISIGTNSCRLLLAHVSDGALRTDYHETRGTRIGEGVNETGRLNQAAVERTLAAVRDYAVLAKGVDRIFGIGTSALRDATDGNSFAKKFEEFARVPLAILTGEEEARSSFAGAEAGFRASGHALPEVLSVIDVGGGSTEVATRERLGAKPHVASLQIGAVRLTETYLKGDPPEAGEIESCRRAVRSALASLLTGERPHGTIVAVGGTANTAARMLQLVDERSYGAIADVPTADLEMLLKATISIPKHERLHLHGLPAQRADIFPAGLMIVVEAATLAKASSLIVSESDLLLGYLAEAL